MMKVKTFNKLVGAAAAVIVLGAGTVSAQINMSAGVFGHGMASFMGGITVEQTHPTMGSQVQNLYDERAGGGFGGFFDITYAELGLGLTFTGADVGDMPGATINQTFFNLSLLGKYPLYAGNSTFYPMAGIEYAIALSGEIKYGSQTIELDGKDGRPDAGDYSQFWLKFGFGGDFNVTETVFIRANLLYGMGFANKRWSDTADETRDFLQSYYPPSMGVNVDVTENLNHGIQARLGVGFRF